MSPKTCPRLRSVTLGYATPRWRPRDVYIHSQTPRGCVTERNQRNPSVTAKGTPPDAKRVDAVILAPEICAEIRDHRPSRHVVCGPYAARGAASAGKSAQVLDASINALRPAKSVRGFLAAARSLEARS